MNNSGHLSQTRYVVQAFTIQPSAFHHPKLNKLLALLIALLEKFVTVSFALFHASFICATIFLIV
jgi:hypothetical protein